MSTMTAASGSPFWRFSLRFYRQDGVADACITLQEEAGVDVNLLLFLLWHATRKRSLSASEIAELERWIAPWRNMTVIPLRTMRRALKSPPALVAGGPAELFRTKLKLISPKMPSREAEVCTAIMLGMTSEAIAIELGISVNTVLTYRKRAYGRLNISCQNELMRLILC